MLFIALKCLGNIYLGVDVIAHEVLSLQMVRIGFSTYLFESREGPDVSEIIFQLFLKPVSQNLKGVSLESICLSSVPSVG